MLPILFDCQQPWEGMPGSERQRHCSACARDVHDLSAMRAVEAKALVMLFQSSGLCVRYTADDQGEIQHLKEPQTAPLLQRIASCGQLGAGVIALTLASGCATAPALNAQPQAAVSPDKAAVAASRAVDERRAIECNYPRVPMQRPRPLTTAMTMEFRMRATNVQTNPVRW